MNIWTSPENAKKIVKYLAEDVGESDQKYAYKYTKNANEYIARKRLTNESGKAIVNTKVKDELVFA